MPHPVIWYSSTDAGAPTLNNAPGSLINVLDACLINGYNARSVTSLSVAAGVATATVSAHGFRSGQIVLVEGATPTALNGRQKVTVTGANTLTFSAPGVPDGTATGTITMKAAPLGWEKRFSGTNKAVYARTAPEATAMVLRIDDTGASPAASTYARALMYEAMADVDTGTNSTPIGLAQGQYWSKGQNGSSAKPWLLVGDDLLFYLFTENFGSGGSFAATGGYLAHAFGDIVSYRQGDAYKCLIGGPDTTIPTTAFLVVGVSIGSAIGGNSTLLARRADQIVMAPSISPSTPFTGRHGASGPAYPSPVDNGGVVCYPVPCAESNSTFGNPLRGHFPGFALLMANVGRALSGQVLPNLIGAHDRSFLVVGLSDGGVPANTNPGCILIDVAGPWR